VLTNAHVLFIFLFLKLFKCVFWFLMKMGNLFLKILGKNLNIYTHIFYVQWWLVVNVTVIKENGTTSLRENHIEVYHYSRYKDRTTYLFTKVLLSSPSHWTLKGLAWILRDKFNF